MRDYFFEDITFERHSPRTCCDLLLELFLCKYNIGYSSFQCSDICLTHLHVDVGPPAVRQEDTTTVDVTFGWQLFGIEPEIIGCI